MKRIVSVIFAVILVISIPLSVSAAVSKPQYASFVDTAIDKVNAAWPFLSAQGFNYVTVFYATGTINDSTGVGNLHIFYTKDSNFYNNQYHMSYHATISANGTVTTSGSGNGYVNLGYNRSGILFMGIVGNTSSHWNGQYIVSDRSNIVPSLETQYFLTVGSRIADLSALKLLIEQAGSKVELENTRASWTVFSAALADAKVLVSGKPTQAQVDAMCARLQFAMNGLVPVDLTQLQETIVLAKTKVESAYTIETWQPFAVELEEAEAVVEERPVQDVVDNATVNLQGAMENLLSVFVFVNDEALETITKTSKNTIAIILPIAIGLFVIVLVIKLIPIIFKRYTKA